MAVGEKVTVETTDGLITSGLLIPRYQHADSNHVVLKLKSGYNIGLEVDKIKSISLVSSKSDSGERSFTPNIPAPSSELLLTKTKKSLLLLSTGGTIASRIDYRTGAVHPVLSAADLYSAIPELDELAEINPRVVSSIYSENMTPSNWESLTKTILDARNSEPKKFDGVVVMIGTDTLAYASAALSFSLIGFDKSVVFVGAQRSSDRPSSDAALNLKGGTVFAVDSKKPGVYVAMHENENDEFIAIHSGVRVRKNHTSRRDAFESIDAPLVARVRDREILYSHEAPLEARLSNDVMLKTKFSPDVALIKFHPGFDPSLLDYLVESKGVKGLIIEGTGLGHVSGDSVRRIAKIVEKKEVFVGITSQCIWGHVDLNVYDNGRDLLQAGGIPLENMFAETAFAKLSWAIANFDTPSVIMTRNLIGEYSPRIPLNR